MVRFKDDEYYEQISSTHENDGEDSNKRWEMKGAKGTEKGRNERGR